MTSKLQVTLPKAIADRHGIRAGDEIAWVEAGDSIRVLPARRSERPGLSLEERVALFDAAMRRADRRAARWDSGPVPKTRGWTRDERCEERVGRARSA